MVAARGQLTTSGYFCYHSLLCCCCRLEITENTYVYVYSFIRYQPSSAPGKCHVKISYPCHILSGPILTNEENRERLAGSIVDYVGNFEDRLEGDKQRIEFKVKVGKRVFNQLVDYQDICDFIEDETMNPDGSYNMKKIIGHHTTGRKNQIVQVLVQWGKRRMNIRAYLLDL